MSALPLKRTTVYFDPLLHKALRIKSAETAVSISDLVNEAVKHVLSEDAEDLASFHEREKESLVSFEQVLKDLKKHGRI
jgi:hypothetical protein